jgi:hypothetical protein
MSDSEGEYKEDPRFVRENKLGSVIFEYIYEHNTRELRMPLYVHQNITDRILRVLDEERDNMRKCQKIILTFPELSV